MNPNPRHFNDWFTFEGRCLLCGSIYGNKYATLHLERHCREGFMTKDGDIYTQIKEHPVGFPKSPYDK
jgi:hypothetical protein